jgi:multicomponent Na+:H+ antiporter subunit G
VRDVVSSVLVLTGVSLFVLAAVGLQRFRDVFTRMHVATKPATLGLTLVLAGAAIQMDSAGAIAKLALVAVLQFMTAPVGAHLVGRAAYRSGTELTEAAVIDELAEIEHPDPDRPPARHGDGETRTSA